MHKNLQLWSFTGVRLASQNKLDLRISRRQRSKGLNQAANIFVGIGLTDMQKIRALITRQSGFSQLKALVVIAQRNHADLVQRHTSTAFNFKRSKNRVRKYPCTATQ